MKAFWHLWICALLSCSPPAPDHSSSPFSIKPNGVIEPSAPTSPTTSTAQVPTNVPSAKPPTGCGVANERVDYPVLTADRPIEQQLQLFGGDEVEIGGSNVPIAAVKFGPDWVPNDRKVYIVMGPERSPTTPAFQFDGEWHYAKLKVRYSCNIDLPRDLRTGDVHTLKK